VGDHRVRASAAELFSGHLIQIIDEFKNRSDSLRDGFVLQYGWGPIYVEDLEGEENDGFLTLRSPDYQGDAENERTQDLTWAIFTVSQQIQFARTLGEQPQEVLFSDDVLAEPGWEDFTDFRLQRLGSPADRRSRWMLVPVDWDFGELIDRDVVQFVPVWKLSQWSTTAASALMLPSWSGVEVRDGAITRVVEWGDEDGSERLIFPTDENEGDNA
jgi:hypothetical protein